LPPPDMDQRLHVPSGDKSPAELSGSTGGEPSVVQLASEPPWASLSVGPRSVRAGVGTQEGRDQIAHLPRMPVQPDAEHRLEDGGAAPAHQPAAPPAATNEAPTAKSRHLTNEERKAKERKQKARRRALKLATLNVEGFRDTRIGEGAFTALVDVLAHHHVDVCVLTETKRRADCDCTVTDSIGARWRVILKDTNGAAGVGLAAREQLLSGALPARWWIEDLAFFNNRISTFDLCNVERRIRIVGGYGPCDSQPADEGVTFLEQLSAKIPDGGRTIVLGDLNAHINF
jgi:hypothetical protein